MSSTPHVSTTRIRTIYAQEDLSPLTPSAGSPKTVSFFLAGPSTPHYSWRTDLIATLEEKYQDLLSGLDITFLIPESRALPGQSCGAGNAVVSYREQNEQNKLFYERMELEGMHFEVINQIQWETYALEQADYVIYNMCQHWRYDPTHGQHGNISPTGRMEVHPQSADTRKWLYYNNLSGNPSINRTVVRLGGEAAGENIGWLLWWIVKEQLPYATSVGQLCATIIEWSQL